MNAIVIGRFNPPHKGHIEGLILPALKKYDEVVVILGSSHSTRTVKNPFTAQERAELIRKMLPEEYSKAVSFAFARDYPYSDTRWIHHIQDLCDFFIGPEAVIIGHDKDQSSYYLGLDLGYPVELVDMAHSISSTDVRNLIFTESWIGLSELYSKDIVDYFKNWLYDNPQFKEEYNWYRDNRIVLAKKAWHMTSHYHHVYSEVLFEQKYKPFFLTVDALVTWQKQVLLIKRKDCPGKGLYALPGGHVEADEWIDHAVYRELVEETHLDIDCPEGPLYSPTKEVLKTFFVKSKVFDHPGRSLKGRVVTTLYQFAIPSWLDCTVTPDDDASEALWVPISELPQYMDRMFDDHWFMIEEMLDGLD